MSTLIVLKQSNTICLGLKFNKTSRLILEVRRCLGMEASQIFMRHSMCLFLENMLRTHPGQHLIWHMRKIAYIHRDMAKMLTQRKGITPKFLFDLS